MTLRTGPIYVLLYLLLTGLAQAAVPFRSKEGGFSIAFPSRPAASTQTVDTVQGKLPLHIWIAEQGDSFGDFFRVAHVTYPDDDGVPAMQRLQTTLDDQLGSETPLYEVPYPLGRFPGREVSYRGSAGKYDRYVTMLRVYVVGRRVYILSASLESRSRTSAAAVKAFFDSFKLVPGP